MWTVFIEFIYWIYYNIASVSCFGFFARRHVDLSSLTRGWTHTPCIGMQSLHHSVSRKVCPPWLVFRSSLPFTSSVSVVLSRDSTRVVVSFFSPTALPWPDREPEGASLEGWRPPWGIPLGFTSRPLHSPAVGRREVSSGFVRVLSLVQHAFLSRTLTGSLGFFSEGLVGCPVAASFSVRLLRCGCPAGLGAVSLSSVRLHRCGCPAGLGAVSPSLPACVLALGASLSPSFFLYCPSTLGFVLYYLERLKIRLPSQLSSQNVFLNRHLKHYK